MTEVPQFHSPILPVTHGILLRQFVLACAENHSGALRGGGVLPHGEREDSASL